jgi:hypothetical protein
VVLDIAVVVNTVVAVVVDIESPEAVLMEEEEGQLLMPLLAEPVEQGHDVAVEPVGVLFPVSVGAVGPLPLGEVVVQGLLTTPEKEYSHE